jgi:hypothetical protein
MVNMAFKHLIIDRLSPLRRLYIRSECELSRTMAPITVEHLCKVKAHLLSYPIPSRLAALIQLNKSMRISEPVLARLDDLVLDHEILHLWVGKKPDRPQNPSEHPVCAAGGRVTYPHVQACLN